MVKTAAVAATKRRLAGLADRRALLRWSSSWAAVAAVAAGAGPGAGTAATVGSLHQPLNFLRFIPEYRILPISRTRFSVNQTVPAFGECLVTLDTMVNVLK